MKIIKKDIPKDQSRFDPSRKTIGAIYGDIVKNNKKEQGTVLVGDMCSEILGSLCDDLNEAFASKPFGERPFYVQVHEKRDMQMADVFRRIIRKSLYRPYPEDDTTVFWHDPLHAETRFCWCLPHWAEMENILKNANLFDKDLVAALRAWKRMDLYHFGFRKNEQGNWEGNPDWKDMRIKSS